jgi:hypothetical protein
LFVELDECRTTVSTLQSPAMAALRVLTPFSHAAVNARLDSKQTRSRASRAPTAAESYRRACPQTGVSHLYGARPSGPKKEFREFRVRFRRDWFLAY